MNCLVCSRRLTSDDTTLAIGVTVGTRNQRWAVCPTCQRVGQLTEDRIAAYLTREFKYVILDAMASGMAQREGR